MHYSLGCYSCGEVHAGKIHEPRDAPLAVCVKRLYATGTHSFFYAQKIIRNFTR